jgi:hypothetical protein
MSTIVIEHVKVEELPQVWRSKFAQTANTRVTVRIEEEAQADAPTEEFVTDDPLFGMERDREDMADVARYIRSMRACRFDAAESRT